VVSREYQLIWSYILSYENAQNLNKITKSEIGKWKGFSSLQIEESPLIIEYAKNLIKSTSSLKDALHVVCAVV